MTSQPVQLVKHIWVISGPAGCGKSSVGVHLAQQLDLPFLEGDDFHTKENVEKMHSGNPLTDADRWDWLVVLRETAVSRIASGATGAVISCSALKRKYRDVFRVAGYFHEHIEMHFVYLHANEELLLERVKARQGHYMKDVMVHSQFASLEEPREEEIRRDCLVVDVSGPSDEVQASALQAVKEVVARAAATTHAKTSS